MMKKTGYFILFFIYLMYLSKVAAGETNLYDSPWANCINASPQTQQKFTIPQGLTAFSKSQIDTIIPRSRRIDWNPGIPGGIPLVIGPEVNILDYGADSTGSDDSHSAIISAMNALPSSGGVVFIPPGTYRITSKISINRNNVIFRGAGHTSKLLSAANGDCFEAVTFQRGEWQTLTVGATKDSTQVVVENGSLFRPGQFAEIEQDNDSTLMYTDPDWIVTWAENSVGQVLEVDRVSGNEVSFAQPVQYSFSPALQARIRPQGLIEGIGFEDLYIEKTVAEGHTFAFKNSAYCWIKNVESYHTRKAHVNQTTCLGNEFRDSYFHASFSYGGGGSGYGVVCGFHVTNTLVENNIFDSLRHSMLVQLGANGNVYGYNYSIHPVQGEGESNLNTGWIPPDISIHGHYPFMNLFEGNDVKEIGIGDFWGPAGPGNTYFRNKISGEGIYYYDSSHNQNVIGNITLSIIDTDQQSREKVEHGNVINSIIHWNPDIAGRNLPDSYYLRERPMFLAETNWPTFGPGIETSNKLPAQIRFESDVLSTSANGTKSVLSNPLVYPNPTRSVITVENISNLAFIELLDGVGHILKKKKINLAKKLSLDLSPYAAGLYFLRFVNNSGSQWSQKIIHNP